MTTESEKLRELVQWLCRSESPDDWMIAEQLRGYVSRDAVDETACVLYLARLAPEQLDGVMRGMAELEIPLIAGIPLTPSSGVSRPDEPPKPRTRPVVIRANTSTVTIPRRRRRAEDAIRILETWAAFLPLRIANEDVGGYIERIRQYDAQNAPSWKIASQVLGALLWTTTSATREFMSALRGRSTG